MALIAFSNPPWLLWPEGLMIAVGLTYLGGVRLAQDGPGSTIRVRVLSMVGLVATASAVLLGGTPSLYTIVAIPVLPAPFVFGALVFQPARFQKWTTLRMYLTVSVAVSVLVWTTQLIWLATR